jgi:hypothetical protein
MRNFKLGIILFILSQNMNANSFEKNCQSCHMQQRQLKMFISRYTLQYSSERNIKNAIFEYLKNPSQEKSVMPMGFLNRFGIKEKSLLSNKELKKSIEQYYNIYNIKQKIQ